MVDKLQEIMMFKVVFLITFSLSIFLFGNESNAQGSFVDKLSIALQTSDTDEALRLIKQEVEKDPLLSDLNKKDKNQFTAVMLAVSNSQSEVLNALIQGGADVNVWSRMGQNHITAIFLAVDGYLQMGACFKCVEILLSAGASADVKMPRPPSSNADTVIKYVLISKDDDLIKLFDQESQEFRTFVSKYEDTQNRQIAEYNLGQRGIALRNNFGVAGNGSWVHLGERRKVKTYSEKNKSCNISTEDVVCELKNASTYSSNDKKILHAVQGFVIFTNDIVIYLTNDFTSDDFEYNFGVLRARYGDPDNIDRQELAGVNYVSAAWHTDTTVLQIENYHVNREKNTIDKNNGRIFTKVSNDSVPEFIKRWRISEDLCAANPKMANSSSLCP